MGYDTGMEWRDEHVPGSPYNKPLMSTEYYPPGLSFAKIPDEESFLLKLIDDHWRYIEGVIQSTGAHSQKHLEEIQFHYITAFRHGWKHHKEYADANHA